MKKMSIRYKFILIFMSTVLLMISALVVGSANLRTRMLRHEAQAVADQVIAFRAWIANSGMVWVTGLSREFPDYLVRKKEMDGHYLYGKNPALATRELSVIANRSATRAVFRVTSDDYRQQANKPDDFELKAIKAFQTNHDLPFFETYEAGKYRYARPITVKAGCLKCHGKPDEAPAAVLEKYGSQKAFGYKIGDIRGIVSVKMPALGWKELAMIFTHPIAVALFIAAFLLNFFFSQQVIKRIANLTGDIKAIARGKLDTRLHFTPPERSNDEIDHMYHAANLLKKSMLLILKRTRR